MPHYSAAKSKLGCYSTFDYLRINLDHYIVWPIVYSKYVESFESNMLKLKDIVEVPASN